MKKFVLIFSLILLCINLYAEEIDYSQFKTLQKEYGLKKKLDFETNKIIYYNKSVTIVASPGMKLILVNGKIIRLRKRIKYINNKLSFPSESITKIRSLIKGSRKTNYSKSSNDQNDKKEIKSENYSEKLTVVLDPGHGGKFPGCIGVNGLKEKDNNLAISKILKSYLEKEGIIVKMTRNRDTNFSSNLTKDLLSRCDFANKNNGDIFVSIHTDYIPRKPHVRGFSVFYYPGGRGVEQIRRKRAIEKNKLTEVMLGKKRKVDEKLKKILFPILLDEFKRESKMLAQHVFREMKVGIPDVYQGIRRARFKVIVYTPCPSILVETGFLSNPKTARKMKTYSYRKKIAVAIGKGIIDFLSLYKKTNRFTKRGETK